MITIDDYVFEISQNGGKDIKIKYIGYNIRFD